MRRTQPNKLERLLAVAMLIAAFLLLSGASDCGGFGAFCDFDSDCSNGRFCVESECREPCTDDGDCFGSDECDVVARQAEDDTVQVCVPTEQEMPVDAGPDTDCDMIQNCCTTDAECQEALGDSQAVCGFDDRCVIPVEQHAVVLRGRTEPGAESDDGIYGADIGAVYVRDAESAELIGFGDVLTSEFEFDPGVPPSEILDGAAPDLVEGGRCIDGDISGDTFSLGGEAGFALVSFVDADGRRIRLAESMELVVIEWGDNCYEQSEPIEGFSMSFCRSFGATIDAREDCTTPLTGDRPVSGYVVIPLDGLI